MATPAASPQPGPTPDTRPPLPWWSAHAAGLIMCQGAYWFGVVQFSRYHPFPDMLWKATWLPASMGLFVACFNVPVVLAGATMLWFLWRIGLFEKPWRRWVGVVGVYATGSAVWCYVASIAADPDIWLKMP